MLRGAVSAVSGEAVAPALAHWLYGKEPKDLTADEKDTISSLASLAGAAVGAGSGSMADIVSGNQIGQNAVDNNALILTGTQITKKRYLNWMNKAQNQYKYILDNKNRIVIEGYHYDDTQDPPILVANNPIKDNLSPSGVVNQVIIDAIKKNEDIYLRLQSDPKYIEQNKILIDDFANGDVDATKDFFQNSDLQALTQTQLHFIKERFNTKNYEKLKNLLDQNDINSINNIFMPGHHAGEQAELDYLNEQFPENSHYIENGRPKTQVTTWKGNSVIQNTYNYGDKKLNIYFNYVTDPKTGRKIPTRPIGVSY